MPRVWPALLVMLFIRGCRWIRRRTTDRIGHPGRTRRQAQEESRRDPLSHRRQVVVPQRQHAAGAGRPGLGRLRDDDPVGRHAGNAAGSTPRRRGPWPAAPSCHRRCQPRPRGRAPTAAGAASTPGVSPDVLRVLRLTLSAARADGVLSAARTRRDPGAGARRGRRSHRHAGAGCAAAAGRDRHAASPTRACARTSTRSPSRSCGPTNRCSTSERRYLDELARHLGLDAAAVTRLEQQAAERIAARVTRLATGTLATETQRARRAGPHDEACATGRSTGAGREAAGSCAGRSVVETRASRVVMALVSTTLRPAPAASPRCQSSARGACPP